MKQFWTGVPLPHGGQILPPGVRPILRTITGTITTTVEMIPLHGGTVETVMTLEASEKAENFLSMTELDEVGEGRKYDLISQAVIQTHSQMTKVLGEEREAKGHVGQVATLTPSLTVTATRGGGGGGTREEGGEDLLTLTILRKEIGVRLRVIQSHLTPVMTPGVTVRVREGDIADCDPVPVPLQSLMRPGHCRGRGRRR